MREYDMAEHFCTVKQLTDKSIEHNIDLWIAFVDFKKVEIWAIIKATRNARIDQWYND